MRADREYLELTVERALRGGRRLTAPQMAISLARTERAILRALERLERRGRVQRSGRGTRDEAFEWALCTLPVDAWIQG